MCELHWETDKEMLIQRLVWFCVHLIKLKTSYLKLVWWYEERTGVKTNFIPLLTYILLGSFILTRKANHPPTLSQTILSTQVWFNLLTRSGFGDAATFRNLGKILFSFWPSRPWWLLDIVHLWAITMLLHWTQSTVWICCSFRCKDNYTENSAV